MKKNIFQYKVGLLLLDLIKLFLKDGKYCVPQRLINGVSFRFWSQLNLDSVLVFYKIFIRMRPLFLLKKIKKGKREYIHPEIISNEVQYRLFLRWLVFCINKRSQFSGGLRKKSFNELSDILYSNLTCGSLKLKTKLIVLAVLNLKYLDLGYNLKQKTEF